MSKGPTPGMSPPKRQNCGGEGCVELGDSSSSGFWPGFRRLTVSSSLSEPLEPESLESRAFMTARSIMAGRQT